MNKHYLKTIINISNEASSLLLKRKDLIKEIDSQINKPKEQIRICEIEEIIDYLTRIKACEWIHNCLDLHPCTLIYAKSRNHTKIEALALFEMWLRSNKSKDLDLLIDESLLKKEEELLPYLQRMQEEFEPNSIITETLNIMVTDLLLENDGYLEYRNEEKETISFDNMDFILQEIPQKGIPVSRDSTKNLQKFYKDVQMHEFDHTCPVCQINLPYLLIASHIKPFRDCAHIYETVNHDNGLLLCRNHDYLFDQGYFTIDDEGNILISDQLENPETYSIGKKIDKKYLTKNRKRFLAYHRKHIFKK